MKYLILFLFFGFPTIINAQLNSFNPLYVISDNNLLGFMDSSGKIIIKPIYKAAGVYAEGLINVRTTGDYGFIDRDGVFVIPPKYDFARPFYDSVALVYEKDKPFFINHHGTKAFNFDVAEMSPMKNRRAMVKTSSGKLGYINNKGKLIIDTIFRSIGDFSKEGLAIATSFWPSDSSKQYDGTLFYRYPYCVIDTMGKTIVPYGLYKEIMPFDDGYAIVEKKKNNGIRVFGIIDNKGKLLLERERQKYDGIQGVFHNELARVSEYENTVNGAFFSNLKYSYLNISGKTIISDSLIFEAEDFSDGRAFIKKEITAKGEKRIPPAFFPFVKYQLIDTKGKTIGENKYDNVMFEHFRKKIAFVQVNGKFGVIDTNGNYIIKPELQFIDDVDEEGKYFLFGERHYAPNNADSFDLIGVASFDGKILIKPQLDLCNDCKYKFVNGLMYGYVSGKPTYLNKKGTIVWQEKVAENSQHKGYEKPNITTMQTGYFGIDTTEQIIGSEKQWNKLREDTIEIMVLPQSKDTFESQYLGHTVYLANTTKEVLYFYTYQNQNGSKKVFDMIVQAKDENGIWKDIETISNNGMMCNGVSMSLKANHYMMFVVPQYDGYFKTKLRIRLHVVNTHPTVFSGYGKKSQEWTIYSNEFDGAINHGQFWKKEE